MKEELYLQKLIRLQKVKGMRDLNKLLQIMYPHNPLRAQPGRKPKMGGTDSE